MFLFVVSFVVLYVVSGANVDKRLLWNVANTRNLGQIDDGNLDEASGLCASRKHPGILYSHNDHGGHNRIYAINATTAKVEAVLTINGAKNKDWEDIACGKCYSHMTDYCIYIGDIGEDDKESANKIYRVQEPDILSTPTVNVDATLTFSWHEDDACTLMLTPDAELYIISKEDDGHGRIAHIPSSAWGQGSATPLTSKAHVRSSSSHDDPRGGDISPDGTEILIKMKEEVLHYELRPGSDIISVLSGTDGYRMAYTMEEKGEAIAFSTDGNSYFTLGEGSHEPLYRYTKA